MAMSKRFRALVWVLTALFFAYNFYLWGGLAITPTVGERLRREAIFESPIAAGYLFFGRNIVDTVGRKDESMAFAAKRFPTLLPGDGEPSQISVRGFLAAQSASGTLLYYGAPLLLLLSLVLHAMRQKPIRSFGTKG